MILNLTLPSCWQELTPRQLRYVYFLVAEGYTPDAIKTYCLCRWSGMEILSPETDGYMVRYAHNIHHLTAVQIAEQLPFLSWLDSVPLVPVRLATIAGHKAAPANFEGVPFEQYLYCDNLYQGYLHTKDTALLEQMAGVLYAHENILLSEEERISIFYWFASVKALFARTFTHFFTSTTQEPADIRQHLLDSVNAQIRALTKGDITKEATVRKMDVWRALTELNAQAADYEELRKAQTLKP